MNSAVTHILRGYSIQLFRHWLCGGFTEGALRICNASLYGNLVDALFKVYLSQDRRPVKQSHQFFTSLALLLIDK